MRTVRLGVQLLDEMLGGGVLEGSSILISGWVGTGKTTLATQLMFYGVSGRSERAVYVCVGAMPKAYVWAMERLGFPVSEACDSGWISVVSFEKLHEMSVSSVLSEILRVVDKIKARILVIDSFTTLSKFFRDKWQRRMLTYVLSNFASKNLAYAILVEEVPVNTLEPTISDAGFVADYLIHLYVDVMSPAKRELRILKARGAPALPVPISYEIGRGGLIFKARGEDACKASYSHFQLQLKGRQELS